MTKIKPPVPENPRYHLLDFLRGILILAMIFFHANYLLSHSFHISIFDYEAFWFWIQTIGVVFFFALSGISFAVFASRHPATFALSYQKKSLLLALVALGITLISSEAGSESAIWFGIIHFFALSFFLLPFFHRFGYFNLFFGLIFICLGLWLGSFVLSTPALFWLGIHSSDFWSADYYPLLPNFGYVLLGFCM